MYKSITFSPSVACTSELEWPRTLVYNPKALLRATKCLSELLDPPGSKASGQCWVSVFSFFWQPSVPHNFLWLGPVRRMLGATVLQDWSIFLALWAAYQELYMGESHKMHVTFFRGPKGRGCLSLVHTHRWQHLTGTLVPHSGAGLTRYWAGSRVCLSGNPFWPYEPPLLLHSGFSRNCSPGADLLMVRQQYRSRTHIAREPYPSEKLGHILHKC